MAYINTKWIADTHAVLDYHEKLDKIPVNPPGGHYTEGDIMLENIGILNWLSEDGEFVFEPRLRDNVQWVDRTGISAVEDEDWDDELDREYDCD